MKQIITRVDDALAEALKRQAGRCGESVNSYVNRLLEVAVVGPGSRRQMWKAAAVADGRLVSRPTGSRAARQWAMDLQATVGTGAAVRTEPGYVAGAVSAERDER